MTEAWIGVRLRKLAAVPSLDLRPLDDICFSSVFFFKKMGFFQFFYLFMYCTVVDVGSRSLAVPPGCSNYEY